MTFQNIPEPVVAFLKATKEHDSEALMATFAASAILTDMGKPRRDAEICDWNDRLFIGSNVVVHPIRMEILADETIVTAIVDGDYADSGVNEPLAFDWHFSIVDGRIAALTMVQKDIPTLPAPIAAYVKANNAFDLDALMDCFAEDALVNDEHREIWGKDAIRKWKAGSIAGRITMNVTDAIDHHGGFVLTATLDGDFDRTGLPDPVVLTFYYSLRDGKISQLIILLNKPAA